MAYKHEADRYNSTPRKVFDKHVDRIKELRRRDREDHRADLQALIKQIRSLQNELDLLTEHVQSHCHVLNDEDQLESSTEGL